MQGERVIISQESFWLKEMMTVVHEHFHDKGFPKVATKEVSSGLLRIYQHFDAQVSLIVPILGNEIFCDNSKAKELLGLKFERNLKTTLVEMVQGMIDCGILVPRAPSNNCTIF